MGAAASRTRTRPEKQLLDATKGELAAFKTYAATDEATFPQLATRDGQARVRAWNRATRSPPQPLPREINAGVLERAAEQVVRAGAGACGQLACAAAYQLKCGRDELTGDAGTVPIEVVALHYPRSTPHMAVLVNRADGADAAPDWGGGWLIVDAWMGAMGHDVVYDGLTHYSPFATSIQHGTTQLLYTVE